ncbi:MAG: hypothetical protein BYD32DRAFT_162180 [Podila humilis]|nr:MAG: hypothetical protein BYD32DRAFT_162180 [Podila humilis]
MLLEYLSLPSYCSSSYSSSLPFISLAPAVQLVPRFLFYRAKKPRLCSYPCNHTHLSNIPPTPQRQSAHQEEASLLPCSVSLVDPFDSHCNNNTPTATPTSTYNLPHWRPQIERPTNNKSTVNDRVNKAYQEKYKDIKARRTHQNSDSGPQVAVTHIGFCSPSGPPSSTTGSVVDPRPVFLPSVPVKSATLPLLTSFTIP